MKDPRKEPGFIPRRFPRCDGQPFAAVSNADGLRRVKAQFLAAYYRINVAYARRVALRPAPRSTLSASPRLRVSASSPPPFAAPRSLFAVLQAIERAIRAKEALEDRYASRGIVATPVYQRGYTVDVRFQHPRAPRSALHAPPSTLHPPRSSSSRALVFALPPALRVKRRTR